MGVLALDHFTIRTEQWAKTAEFFERVVGLAPGPRPDFRFPGCWMYAGGRPLLHIASIVGADKDLQAYLGEKKGGLRFRCARSCVVALRRAGVCPDPPAIAGHCLSRAGYPADWRAPVVSRRPQRHHHRDDF